MASRTSRGASFSKKALIAPSKGSSMPGLILVVPQYGGSLRRAQSGAGRGAVDGGDDLGSGGMVGHVADAVEGGEICALDLLGEGAGMDREADGGVGGAVGDLDRNGEFVIAEVQRLDLGEQVGALQGVGAQAVAPQGQPRADMIEIALGGRLRRENL